MATSKIIQNVRSKLPGFRLSLTNQERKKRENQSKPSRRKQPHDRDKNQAGQDR